MQFKFILHTHKHDCLLQKERKDTAWVLQIMEQNTRVFSIWSGLRILKFLTMVQWHTGIYITGTCFCNKIYAISKITQHKTPYYKEKDSSTICDQFNFKKKSRKRVIFFYRGNVLRAIWSNLVLLLHLYILCDWLYRKNRCLWNQTSLT